jgi:hypothetical protein
MMGITETVVDDYAADDDGVNAVDSNDNDDDAVDDTDEYATDCNDDDVNAINDTDEYTVLYTVVNDDDDKE